MRGIAYVFVMILLMLVVALAFGDVFAVFNPYVEGDAAVQDLGWDDHPASVERSIIQWGPIIVIPSAVVVAVIWYLRQELVVTHR